MSAVRRAGALLLLVSLAAVTTAATPPRKKLIEFGWDEPSTRFMRDHIRELQASPFDGCVFHLEYESANGDSGNFAWEVWGRRRFTMRDLDSARANLRATKFGRFRDNFLRVNVTPGNLDWFEDHTAVMSNLELAARIAREADCPGILFDIEQYQDSLFDFRAQTRKRPRTWDAMAAQVRKRGAETMRAFERGYPGLTVFTTMAYSLPLHETGGGIHPVTNTHYGLLIPFLDGMVSAAGDNVVLVDGHAHSYPYRERVQFAAKADTMRRGVLRVVAQPNRYLRMLSVCFGVWMDNEWQKYGWDENDVTRNYFTPAALGASVQYALDLSDRYVWVYSERPRWWSPERRPKALPAAYDSVLRSLHR